MVHIVRVNNCMANDFYFLHKPVQASGTIIIIIIVFFFDLAPPAVSTRPVPHNTTNGNPIAPLVPERYRCYKSARGYPRWRDYRTSKGTPAQPRHDSER